MSELFEMGKQALAEQPFSVLLGAELIRLGDGGAELHLPIRDELKQQHGFVHGGVLAYLADNALTCAGASMLQPVITSEFKINYLRPAIGELLIARADAVYAGRNQAVCRCDIFVVRDGQEKLCATAQGTIAKFQSEA